MDKSRVLVVEDHPMSRKMLNSMLKKKYTVIEAASGHEAVTLAKGEKPDLVLLDIEMPGMDGFQTLEALRQGVIDQAVPVIFLTAREDKESRGKGLEAGAVDYITKPYDGQELAIKVKNHLALYEARKEIERKNLIMAKEMEMAYQLQLALLPQSFPHTDRLQFAVSYVPTSRASGDFYDVIELPDEKIGFVQVDVAGHGVHSAMIGAMFKMAFQTLARDNASPGKLLHVINNEMFRILPDSDFLTVFYGVIDIKTLRFVYSNAGHPKPFLYSTATGTLLELAQGGTLVGAFPNMEYDEEILQLEAGDRFLIFTDGVTEAAFFQDSTQLYGSERLKDLFCRTMGDSPDPALNRILRELAEFRGGNLFDDDLSMLLISVE